ncbi:Uncharacterised protein [Serratia fonticola]|uniref:Uncharacterized protein n=1 Tax=Serratia fonticola TaxID=47917 RepID=A0A4V6KSJ5_SERFO|nr:Uncharacterised protein [Serratia fonticola]
MDTWQPQDAQALEAWQTLHGQQRPVFSIEQGRMDIKLLDRPRTNCTELPDAQHHHSHAKTQGLAALRLPENSRWRRALNQGQGFTSCGWIFDGETVFDTVGMMEWIRLAPVDRAKAVVRIAEGSFADQPPRAGSQYRDAPRRSARQPYRIDPQRRSQLECFAIGFV